MTDLEWLRALLDDETTGEAEIVEGDGATATFFVRNPPLPNDDTTTVIVGGIDQVRGVNPGFIVTDSGRSITITPPPSLGIEAVIRYSSQTWSDAELSGYLAEAALDWSTARGRVYAATVLALDTLLAGTATALNFGSGDGGTYDIASVNERLVRLRAVLAGELAAHGRRPALFPPAEPTEAA